MDCKNCTPDRLCDECTEKMRQALEAALPELKKRLREIEEMKKIDPSLWDIEFRLAAT